MKKRIKFGLGALGAALVGGLLGGGSIFGIRSGYEEAAHEVLLDDGNFEVRQYEDALVARTVTTGDMGEAGSAAFRRLGGYIFGKNVTRDSVAMTTPVFQEEAKPATAPESESIAMTTPVFQEESAEGKYESTHGKMAHGSALLVEQELVHAHFELMESSQLKLEQSASTKATTKRARWARMRCTVFALIPSMRPERPLPRPSQNRQTPHFRSAILAA